MNLLWLFGICIVTSLYVFSCSDEVVSDLSNSCGRSAVSNGGTNPACTGVYPEQPTTPRPDPSPLPTIEDGAVIDRVSSLLIDDRRVPQNQKCISGVSITIIEHDGEQWAFVSDVVYTRYRGNQRLPNCFFQVEDRYSDPIKLSITTDRYDPYCQEFRGYRSRRQIFAMRNRTVGGRSCYVEDDRLRNVIVGSHSYAADYDAVIPPLPRRPRDVTSSELLEIKGWSYNKLGWPYGEAEFLGDYNSRTVAAFIDLDEFPGIRRQFNFYMNRYNWHHKPTLKGYIRNRPEYYEKDGKTVEVPFLFITNMVINHRDFLNITQGRY